MPTQKYPIFKPLFRVAAILFASAVLVFALLSLTRQNHQTPSNPAKRFHVISTIFPGYDFTRAVAKDNTDIDYSMLLAPGAESHTYEPTPSDITKIQNADLFIYVGGESDAWVDDILSSLDSRPRVLKMLDLVDPLTEENVPGMESDPHHDDSPTYDEHVWTSPQNAAKITTAIAAALSDLNPHKNTTITANRDAYLAKLTHLDQQFRTLVSTAPRHTLIFADRFPLRYFVDTYNLQYFAAFPGCSEQTEASANTIAFLEDKVKNDHIPVIFTVEQSNQNLAKTIASATGAKILTFNSLHNISKADFDRGATYVELMTQNLTVLKEALGAN